MEIKNVQNYVFAAVFAVLFLLLARLFAPFFTMILWSVLLYILFSPLFRGIVRSWRPESKTFEVRRQILAGTFAVISVLGFLTPLAFIAVTMFQQVLALVAELRGFIERSPSFLEFQLDEGTSELLRKFSFGSINATTVDVQAEILKLLQIGSRELLSASTAVVRNVGVFGISVFFMVFTIYFFYVDGEHLLSLFVRAIPIRDAHVKDFIDRFRETAQHLFMGYFLVALYQAVAGYALFTIFGVQHAVLLAVLILLCSFIPMLGAFSIWGPVSVVIMIQGDLFRGILLAVLCFFLVSTVDNFLRPILLTQRIKIHPLLIFLSILGGLAVYGFNGLILGPMILMLFFTALDIFLDLYQFDKSRNPNARNNTV